MISYLLRMLGVRTDSKRTARGGGSSEPFGQDWNRSNASSALPDSSDGDAAVIAVPAMMSPGDTPEVCSAPASDSTDYGSYSCSDSSGSDSGGGSSDSGSSSSD